MIAAPVPPLGTRFNCRGQVLRHHDEVTTSIYAKVDRRALDLVVRPWPEATR